MYVATRRPRNSTTHFATHLVLQALLHAHDEAERAARMRRVTLGLAATGAVCGGVIGSALLTVLLGLGPGGRSASDFPLGVAFGGTFGALVGALGAPLLGWGLLRTVPLGRAIGLAALGTIAGATLGYIASGRPVMGGLLGFVAGGLLARSLTASRPRRPSDP